MNSNLILGTFLIFTVNLLVNKSNSIEIDWQALSAIATFLAVLVALYQTRIANKKKLKIKFIDNVKIISSLAKNIDELIDFTIINTVNKNITIRQILLYHTKEDSTLLLTDLCKYNLNNKLPKKIKPENSIDIYFERRMFLNLIKKMLEEDPKLKNKKLKFIIKDSVERQYTTKTKKTYNDYLLESKGAEKSNPNK